MERVLIEESRFPLNRRDKLIGAILNNDLKITSKLFREGDTVGYKDSCTILERSQRDGLHDTARLLLNQTSIRHEPLLVGDILLHNAIDQNSFKVVESLVAHRVNLNSRRGYGVTALHAAAQKNNPSLIKLLLEKGANANLIDDKGRSPLHSAVVDSYGSKSTLKSVRCLLEHGLNIDAIDNRSYTTLHYALMRKLDDVAKLLVDEGADLDIKTTTWNGRFPLGRESIVEVAMEQGCLKTIEALIVRGSMSVSNSVAQTKLSPIHIAAKNSDIQMLKVLVKFGASVEQVDHLGRRPIHFAADIVVHRHNRESVTRCIRYLLKRGVAINAQDKRGCAPLHYATDRGSHDIVEILLAKGADVNVQTKAGNKPFSIVRDRERVLRIRHGQSAKLIASIMLKKHLAGLQYSQKQLRQLEDFLSKLNTSLSDFGELKKDLILMKNCTLCNYNLFSDIFIARDPLYRANRPLMKALKSIDFKAQYPSYGSLLKGKIDADGKRHRLISDCLKYFNLSRVIHSLKKDTPLMGLPSELIRKILSKLDAVDIYHFLVSLEPISLLLNPSLNEPVDEEYEKAPPIELPPNWPELELN